MARPIKKGLDYFPMNVNPDRKIKLLVRKYGLEGKAVYTTLLEMIYQEGYFLQLDDDFEEDFSIEYDMNLELVGQILVFMCRKELFDVSLFEKKRVLSSKGVQSRFLEATKKRSINNTIEKHDLLSTDGVNAAESTPEQEFPTRKPQDSEINAPNSAQSKVNERKLKNIKSKREKEKDFALSINSLNFGLPDNEIEKFIKYWTESSPNSQKLKHELERSFDPIRRLENWKDRSESFKSDKFDPDDMSFLEEGR